ncbi:hypothetical protein [Laribacter hongkongensis]|uniref:Uncharacterized protein n=1 Tax=Laribacter hongkongensis TaxID=168471 RepID=A0ABD4SUM6_9NEIS|nr:hypothetical protein [Laribacter hongkongensis]MCG8999810.1 hypothetical protein [Laribacter hongkongensis]MCG9014566.1 hypothetical protein [Laribacter hongkongensis]MCG9027440.1 hypothetical protein [Laribacter hongkongensis]MCG9046620.1 hypothetical protein [Laribacter hongkongensis]MCG9051473.1 hypothetical protein [Laribacter hongkongensis]
MTLPENAEFLEAEEALRPFVSGGQQFSTSRDLGNTATRPHTATMSTSVHTELLDAKLQAIETRMDARIQRIEDKMDAFVDANKETQASVKSLKLTIVLTSISTVVAIVLGVAAFNSTVLNNMVAAFESGKNTSSAQAQVQQQLRDTQVLLDNLKKQQQ